MFGQRPQEYLNWDSFFDWFLSLSCSREYDLYLAKKINFWRLIPMYFLILLTSAIRIRRKHTYKNLNYLDITSYECLVIDCNNLLSEIISLIDSFVYHVRGNMIYYSLENNSFSKDIFFIKKYFYFKKESFLPEN